MSAYLKMGFCAVVLGMLGGCATVPQTGASIAEVGAGMVQGCKLLGTVHGHSTMGGLLQSAGVSSAKRQALQEAAQWNANAVVWTHITQSYWVGQSADGNAYNCSQVASN